MENGRISEIGTYAELIDNNGAFAEFVRTYASMEESDEGEKAGRVKQLYILNMQQSCCRTRAFYQLLYIVLWNPPHYSWCFIANFSVKMSNFAFIF